MQTFFGLNEFEVDLQTGMRRSEQFSREWEETGLGAERIHLLKTKNGSNRLMPLSSVAEIALERQLVISEKTEWGFVTEDSKPLIQKPIRRWFEGALVKAKIPDSSWHCLRHTFYSRLVIAGVPLKTVQELMDKEMTARYAHLSQGHLQNGVELVRGRNSHQYSRQGKKGCLEERRLVFISDL